MNPSLFDALAAIGYPTGKIPTHPAFGKFYRAGAYWLKMITDGVAVFGNWATSEKTTWFADNLPTDPKAIAERKRLINLETQRIKRQQAKEWQEAAIRARYTWLDYCTKADLMHPYLRKKDLKPLGLRQFKHELVIPVYSLKNGGIQSLQFIAPNGSKRFLSGGKTKEGFYTNRPFHQSNDKRIIIAEGWATSQSLAQQWQVQGWHVTAFNAGNLAVVAKAMRLQFPKTEIIIAADNDQSGTGQAAAQLAAKAVGASVSMPEFTDDERAKYGKVSDWQDRWMIDQSNKKEVSRYAD
jgi:putative DNA primase/helicase